MRLRTPTMTPTIELFNGRRKYQVHSRTEDRRLLLVVLQRGCPESVGMCKRETTGDVPPGTARAERSQVYGRVEIPREGVVAMTNQTPAEEGATSLRAETRHRRAPSRLP
jgi:hypothetical protein